MLRNILICLISTSAFGQNIVHESDLDLNSGGSGFFFGIGEGSAEIFPFFSDDSDYGVLCVRDKNRIIILNLEEEFSIRKKIETLKPQYSTLLGGRLNKSKLTLIYSLGKNRTFKVQEIDLESNNSIKETSFELAKKEKFITFISENNECYLITSLKNSSQVNVYPFYSESLSKKIEFQLEPIQVNGAVWPFYYVFEKTPIFISEMSPASFEQASSKFKIYANNGTIRMTMDNVYSFTKVVTLNINTGESSIKKYEKGVGSCRQFSTNSLLFEQSIFILTLCNSYVNLIIRNLNSGLELNSFLSSNDEPIYFANTPLIQDGGGTVYSQDRHLIMENSKKFLAKSSRLIAAMVVEEVGDKLVLTIGGTKELTQAQNVGGYAPGASFASVPSYNHTFGSYQSASWSKSTYFKTLLNNSTFEHFSGKVKDGIYDRVEKYESSLTRTPKIKTILKRHDNFYFCYYDKKQDKLIFTEFD